VISLSCDPRNFVSRRPLATEGGHSLLVVLSTGDEQVTQYSGSLSQRTRSNPVLPAATVLICGKVSETIRLATDEVMPNIALTTLTSSRAV
jgi:hypothetical protein